MPQILSAFPTVLGNATDNTHAILSAPIVGKVDTIHLFLTVGIVLVAVIVWTRILAHIQG